MFFSMLYNILVVLDSILVGSVCFSKDMKYVVVVDECLNHGLAS